MTGGLEMGVNVAAHTRHIFLGSAPHKRQNFLITRLTFLSFKALIFWKKKTKKQNKTKQNKTKQIQVIFYAFI